MDATGDDSSSQILSLVGCRKFLVFTSFTSFFIEIKNIFSVVFWSVHVGADDQSAAAFLRGRPVRNGGLPERWLSTSPTNELSRSALLCPGFMLGIPASRKSFSSTTSTNPTRASKTVAAICLDTTISSIQYSKSKSAISLYI